MNSDRRRITFVIERLAMRSGGAERVLIETANALALRGHQVEILCHEPRDKAPFYPTVGGVVVANLMSPRKGWRHIAERVRSRLSHLPDRPLLDRVVSMARDGGFAQRLERHLRAMQPDVVVAFMPPAISALASVQVDHPMRRVASMHNAPEQDFENLQRWNPTRRDQRRRLALMSRMDRIMVLLPEYRDWYPDHLRDRVVVVPNAVKPRVLTEGLVRENVVMSVGRLASVKRHALLLTCWARLAPRFPDWQLRIWGDGPLHDALGAQILDAGLTTATLMGHRSDVADHYMTASILAHPAEFEGFPLAVTEALASGMPVVGFEDCSGLNRLVQNGSNGILLPAGDGTDAARCDAFTAALSDLMLHTDQRVRLGAAGPESMKEFLPDPVIDIWERILLDRDPECGSA